MPAINKDDYIQTQRPGGQYMLLDTGITSIKILLKTILPIKIYKEALFNVACNVALNSGRYDGFLFYVII